MIRAGEEGGFLEDVLTRIADYTEREAELRGKVMGAMAYPMFLSIIGVLVVTGLVVFFVPKFEKMFNKLRAKGQLPSITECARHELFLWKHMACTCSWLLWVCSSWFIAG